MPEKTSDTVDCDTPQRRATSTLVTRVDEARTDVRYFAARGYDSWSWPARTRQPRPSAPAAPSAERRTSAARWPRCAAERTR